MSDLLDDLRTERAKPKPCKLGRIIAELDDERREAVEAALAEGPPEFPDHQVAAGMTRWGHSVGAATVRRHRLGECSCA